MARAFVGLGSNVAPASNLRAALSALAAEASIEGVSTIFRTPALGPDPRPEFYNGVVEIETELSAEALKRTLQRIEAKLGRVRTEDKWAPRTIDLDVLLFARGPRVDAEMLPPSDEIRTRAFVAVPLAELASELVFPDGSRLRDLTSGAPQGPMEPRPSYTEEIRRQLGLAPFGRFETM